ncbi:MAG: hypothetical protein JSV33_05565 [bacterium]|nr:MAG: hypothetical protein JSV33_05565 [bacterium]
MSQSTGHTPHKHPASFGPVPWSTWTQLAFYVVLFLLCLLTFHGITDNYLFNDDFSWLSAARYGMNPANLLTYRVVNFFRPLINLSFFVMERVAPANIRFNATLNLALHFINTILVFHLLTALLKKRQTAMAAAVLFAVTSLHTGAVFWISARTTLLSTLFVLASLTVAASGGKETPARTAAAVVLFIMALAAKETAIAGLPLVLLIYLLDRHKREVPGIAKRTVIAFEVVAIAYLVIRKAVMGGFVQANWGPGAHAVRNLAGGFLYQFYPWPFFSLFYVPATRIPEPVHPIIPEVLVVPLILVLLLIGARTKRLRTFALSIGWTLLALLPASPFRYRFFSTVSITQNRYYYLSSVGSVCMIAVLLSVLWSGRSRIRTVTCTVLFLILCIGYIHRVDRLEKKWAEFTGMYREVVTVVTRETRRHGASTIAMENPLLAFPYMREALSLVQPTWKVVEITGGRDEAMWWRPCLYISYMQNQMRFEMLE